MNGSSTAPLEIAKNFELKGDTLTSTSATFTWSAVDRSLEKIRGFFRGYRVSLISTLFSYIFQSNLFQFPVYCLLFNI